MIRSQNHILYLKKKCQEFLQWKEHGYTHMIKMMMLMLMHLHKCVYDFHSFFHSLFFLFVFSAHQTSATAAAAALVVVVAAAVTVLCSDWKQMLKHMPHAYAGTHCFVYAINSKIV